MFNLFKSFKCPINNIERDWIETNVIWLCKEFGYDKLISKDVQTSKSWALSNIIKNYNRNNVNAIVEYVCKVMEIDPSIVNVEIYSENKHMEIAPGLVTQQLNGTAGLYTYRNILIEESELNSPNSLIATLAHELSHLRLLGEGRIDADEEEDHELLTDLTAGFLGFGAFGLNNVFKMNKGNDGWSTSRKGYMSVPMYSYFLAVLALCRGETIPQWRDEITYNGKVWFDQSLRYMKKSCNTIYYPIRQNHDNYESPINKSLIHDRLSLATAVEDYEYADFLSKLLKE